MSDVLVLCYHAVSKTWPAALSVKPDELEHQLEGLVRRGYRGVTFSDAVRSRERGRQLAVTFDDAYRSVLELALPILSRLGLPGTVFVPTDFPDTQRPMAWAGIDRWLGGPHEPELTPLSWDELEGLAEAGWEIGSHTCTHPHLTRCDDRRLGEELSRSRARCEERLARACTSVAYPYGDVDARVLAGAREAGYTAGAALPAQLYAPRPLAWPRIGVYHEDAPWRFALKVARLRRAPGVGPAAAALSRYGLRARSSS